MNILFVSKDLNAGNLAFLLKKEGHSVRLFIENKSSRNNLDNIVEKSANWRSDLKWVGKDGLIIFDEVGYGKAQDKLRKQGYKVFGGSELTDKLEMDREFGQKIFAQYGMSTVPLKDFDNIDDAVVYVQNNRKAWVIKQNENGFRNLSYVGHFDDGRDVISVLKNYLQNPAVNSAKVSLHERIHGVELAVARSFNGTDWVGPVKMNIEHKYFFPGDLGQLTSEMGTIAWYEDDEDNKLFNDTLGKLKPFLKEAGFRGEIDLNCIVNERGAYILEATPRFGTPIVHLHSELQTSPWGEFLYAVANNKDHDLKWKSGMGIVVLLAVPPFPYAKKSKENLYYGVNIYFEDFSADDFKHVHFEEVALRTYDMQQYYISDNQGYVLYVTGHGKSMEEAQNKAYALARKIVLPKVMYRNDIGDSFKNKNKALLEKWGYIKPLAVKETGPVKEPAESLAN